MLTLSTAGRGLVTACRGPRSGFWRNNSTDGEEVNDDLRHSSFIDPAEYLYLKYTTESEQANFVGGRYSKLVEHDHSPGISLEA
jgi:hypothetical protein